MHKLTVAMSGCFFLFIVWVIYLANTGQDFIFFDLVRFIPYGDKIGHLCIFGFLALAVNFACRLKTFSIGRLNVLWGSAAVFVFVTIEELSQHFMSTRTMDIFDYTANLVGIAIFTWLSVVIARKKLSRGYI